MTLIDSFEERIRWPAFGKESSGLYLFVSVPYGCHHFTAVAVSGRRYFKELKGRLSLSETMTRASIDDNPSLSELAQSHRLQLTFYSTESFEAMLTL